MKRLAWFSAVLAAFATAALAQVGAPVAGAPQFAGANGVPFVWARYHIPIFVAPTGTMANNGAMTLGTALNTTYADAYFALPAGAVAAGVPAATDTYYAQCSSTTACIVCNNRLADNLDSVGGPKIPAACTAFATTGPGAFTGVTATVTMLTLALPAATLGTTGILDFDVQYAFNNTAGNKTPLVSFGGSNITNTNIASAALARFQARVQNRNSASVQSMQSAFFITSSVSTNQTVYAAVNTGNATNIVFSLTHGTAATDVAGLESLEFLVTR